MRKKPTILLVEDDPFFVRLCVDILEERGYSVSVAIDGKEALEQFRAEKPDLIILDLLLPKLHGYEVLKEIRKNSDAQLAKTPVIIMTNLYQEEERERCETLKIEAYLMKAAITTDDLRMKVREILEKSSQESSFQEKLGGNYAR